MPRKSINFYGYDKEMYDSFGALICRANRRHMEIVNLWFLVLNALLSCFASFEIFGINRRFLWFYIVYLCIAAGLEILFRFAPRAIDAMGRLMVILDIAILVSFGILSSLSQPYMASAMFPVLLVVIGISFIDTFSLMTGTLMLSCIVFLFFSFRDKAYAIAYQDLYHAIVFFGLAEALHYTFQHIRMCQFEAYQKNVQMQQELDVKASFDTLTSLLNRGRFFSLANEVLHSSHQEYLALCLMNLDAFREMNDKLGHEMGDKALQIAGSTILHTIGTDTSEKWSLPERIIKGKMNFAGRIGGDEFVFLLRTLPDREQLVSVLQNMLLTLNQVKFGDLHGIDASIGVVEITDAQKDIDHVYRLASDTLAASRQAGKNRITFSNQETGGNA